MNVRTSRILLTLALAGVSAFPTASLAEGGFIGEDLGLDLYRKVDVGIAQMRNQNLEKRLKGNAAKLNSASRVGTKYCRNKDGAAIPCFEPGRDFTAAELAEIEAGVLAPIFRHLRRDAVLTSEGAEGL